MFRYGSTSPTARKKTASLKTEEGNLQYHINKKPSNDVIIIKNNSEAVNEKTNASYSSGQRRYRRTA